MDTPLQETSPAKSLPPSESRQRAEENTARGLEALDQKGEKGPGVELDRTYPRPHGYHELFHAVIADPDQEGNLKLIDYASLSPEERKKLEADPWMLEPSDDSK